MVGSEDDDLWKDGCELQHPSVLYAGHVQRCIAPRVGRFFVAVAKRPKRSPAWALMWLCQEHADSLDVIPVPEVTPVAE